MNGLTSLLTLAALSFSAGMGHAQTDNPVDLTGRWCATTYYDGAELTNRTEKAEIMIVMTGTDIRVETSHGSSWTGTYAHETRLLDANYVRNQYTGRVALWLDSTGQRLDGEWVSQTGASGRYTAHPKRGESCADPLLS